jgi:type I restriction enzyme S subunit
MLEGGAPDTAAALSVARDVAASAESIFGDRLRRVVLFGSCARSEADEDSDVDILVILDTVRYDDRRYGSPMKRAAARVGTQTRQAVNVIFAGEQEVRAPVKPILRNALRDAIDVQMGVRG